MIVRRLAAGGVLLCAAVGCATDPPAATPEPGQSAGATDGTAPPPTSVPVSEPVTTLDLRYQVEPQTDKLFSVDLPRQQPGGTLITWSAFLSGVGAAASPSAPLKAECYVVQATGTSFDDRVFYLADDSSVSTGFDISLSGSGVVDTAEGERLTFECELDENLPDPIPRLRWQTLAQQPVQVTMTPLQDYRQQSGPVS